MDNFAQLNEYSFIGPLDILTSAGGLFASLKLVVVLILSASTVKYYKKHVAKAIKVDQNKKYSNTKTDDLIKLMIKRMSSVELFHLYDKILHVE
jgi:hypothetical protein